MLLMLLKMALALLESTLDATQEKWKMFSFESSPEACSRCLTRHEPFNRWIHQMNETHADDEGVRRADRNQLVHGH